jgi:putative tricarboxylic transport membrane protein
MVQTSALGQGNFMIMFQSPISVSILLLAVLLAVGPWLVSRFKAKASDTKDLTHV